MHDVLEGVAQYEVKELIRHFIQDHTITLNQINTEIEFFPYSYNDIRDKPTAISPATLSSADHNIKQKGIVIVHYVNCHYLAAQMWCLSRLLPLMIGKDVGADDQHWDNFLLLLKIMDYIFAPIVSQEVASYLRVLIDDHHREFVRLYPSCPVTPKLHYMIHYPEWMSRCVCI